VRSSGRIRPPNLLKDSAEKLCPKGWQEASQVCTQVDEVRGGTLGHLQESPKTDRWLEFSEEDLRNPEGRQITERFRGDTQVFPRGSKLRRGRTVDPSHKGRRIYM
jgi:hypothetical protein